jgi:DNA-binding response OmpR family regulator
MDANILLLVDDEPLVRESLAEFLMGAGFELRQAGSEEEAFELGMSVRPAVVLSDLMLGKGSGLSLFARLKKELAGADEPCCILMTGFGTVENAIEAIRAGVDDYLLKPIKLDELDVAVKGGMARRRFRGGGAGGGADPGAALADRFYHEVSAPLTVLRAYLDMFAEGRFGPLTMVQEEKMQVVKDNMQQVVRVLRGFHDRIEDVPAPGSRESLDPAALLREVQKAFFLDFERRGVNVVLSLPSQLPKVEAERRQAVMLAQALIGNCLANARPGMTMRVRWILKPGELALQFRLEPWNGAAKEDLGFPAFDGGALAEAGLRIENNPSEGMCNLVFSSLSKA